ncbi:MAG: hypothetical protein MJA82_00355 [Clostridia bacterium]|nr:hypothetical protein [Clostridia bacterium]
MERKEPIYDETVADMEEGKTPDLITKEEAKEKLLSICKTEAIKEFDECTLQNEPYLVLVDGSLV